MKILIVGFAKIKYMPYLNLYLENIDRKNNEVHLLYWNRDLKDEDTTNMDRVTLHEFKCFQEDDVPKFFKIVNFLKFKRYAKNVFAEKFDFVIVMQSVPCVILSKQLLSKFKNKYIYDYRDFTYEDFSVYKRIIHKLVENSYKTFVSSDAFRKNLPKIENKILTVHNIIPGELEYFDNYKLIKENCGKIRVSFWGFIREKELNIQIIKKFSSDDRFELHYYGREQQIANELRKFVNEQSLNNVFFHGEYKPEEKKEFALNTDIIHNVYNDKQISLAMTNKYYDGVIFKRPQICMTGSFMGELVSQKKIGLNVSPWDSNFTQEVFSYWKNLNCDEFHLACEEEIARVKNENAVIYEIIKSLNK